MKYNFQQYKHLLSYRCFSYDDSYQNEFLEFLEWELSMYNFTITYDEYGNLIADRCHYDWQLRPLIIAHVDINQRDEKIPTFLEVDGYVIGMSKGVQKGCGHDDRAGVYFALLFAQSTDLPCRIIFTKDEEVGGIGAGCLPSYAFDNITMAVQLDRRGNSDISESTNGVTVVSKEFKNLTKNTLKNFGYSWTRTIFTDVGVLASDHNVNFCCMNISCGYYEEHTDSERLCIKDFQNAVDFAYTMLTTYGYSKVHTNKPIALYTHNSWNSKYSKGYANAKWDSIPLKSGKKDLDKDYYDKIWDDIVPKKTTDNNTFDYYDSFYDSSM